MLDPFDSRKDQGLRGHQVSQVRGINKLLNVSSTLELSQLESKTAMVLPLSPWNKTKDTSAISGTKMYSQSTLFSLSKTGRWVLPAKSYAGVGTEAA